MEISISQIAELAKRWDDLYDANYSVRQIDKEAANLSIYFKEEILGARRYEDADKLLKKIEEADEDFQLESKKREDEQKATALRDKRNDLLCSTDWTMLADAPLSQEGRKLYREYRQYLRDIPDLWRRQQILELKVMNFKEWREDSPKYKIDRKVII